MKMKIRHSLFFRFFLTLAALGIVPMGISAFFLVATYQVRIADAVSAEIAQELLFNAGLQFFLIFLFVLVMATFAAFMVSRNISRPLGSLTEAARRMSEGDLNLNIKIERKDEIGTLGEFFNDMVGHVKDVQKRQEEISRLKSEFIAVAAHQLRTPLSIMKWTHATVLEGDLGKVPPKQKEALEKAVRANESMIRLVHNLLDAARIEEGKFGYKFERINLVQFLLGLIEEKKLFAENKKVTLDVGGGVMGTAMLQGDPERLSMAIGNIIDNAIRYTSAGGTTSIDLSTRDGFAVVRIKDSGVGITPQEQEKLFTKFFRGASVMHLETPGTGLGLFIAKNIVLSHGGSIRFESAKGEGTTFFIHLPLEPAVEQPRSTFESFVERV